MKYVLVSLAVLVFPMINSHRLFGFWAYSEDYIPIEDHLHGKALHVLESVVDNAVGTQCQNSKCEKGLIGYFRHILNVIVQ